MSSPCAVKLNEQFPELSKEKADELLLSIKNIALAKSQANGGNIEKAMEETLASFVQMDKMDKAVLKRNALLDIEKINENLDYANRHPMLGEGLKAKLVGGKSTVPGTRDSIYTQMKAIEHGYVERLANELEELDAFRAFGKNENTKNVYIEMGEIRPDGKPGITGDKNAQNIAMVLNKITKELNARLRLAGAQIPEMPGYIDRQTHDVFKIRKAGSTKAEARGEWERFLLPLIDHQKTFLGADKAKFLLNVHDSLYSGVHGVMGMEGQGIGNRGTGARWNKPRIIHFKSPEAAWEYNQRFGVKDFKEQVLTDIANRARSIALMENLGPNSEQNLLQIIRDLTEQARERPDAVEQLKHLQPQSILAYYRQLTGVNNIPENPTLARLGNNTRALIQMAKMGGVAITNFFTDKAMMQTEAMYQGIKNLDTLAKQITQFAKRTPNEKRALRIFGVGVDGLMGNFLSRYSAQGPVSGFVDKAQKTFFDWNFSNFLNDSTKSAAAELFAANLGEHADLAFKDLPFELKRVLSLYDITNKEWNLLRSTVYEHPTIKSKMVTPDQLPNLTDEQIATLWEGEKSPTAKDLQRLRNKLDTQLRGFFIDRANYAVPTPGAAEKRWSTLDTKSGTYTGEAVRLLMLFKNFPITIANKILPREIYGRGNVSVKDFLLNDHKGVFNMATLVAMSTVAGYIGMTLRDAINSKTPRSLIKEDGSINFEVLQDAMIQGGGMGIYGELVTRNYTRGMGSFLDALAGPALSDLNKLMDIKSRATMGDPYDAQLLKLALSNTPLINLFYLKPIFNYLVIWNLQEMLNPGTLRRMERNVKKNNQDFLFEEARPTKVYQKLH